MLTIAICDDDKNCAAELKRYTEEILQFTKSYQIDIYNNGNDLFKNIESHVFYDLIILDIDIGDFSGITLAKRVRKNFNSTQTLILFVSANNECFKELFELQPHNFVDKPVDPVIFKKTTNVAFSLINYYHPNFEWLSQSKFIRVPVRKILYFETVGRQILLTTEDDQHLFKAKLSDVQDTLPINYFLMINQSFLVNANKVKSFKSEHIVTFDNRTVYISRNKKKQVKQFYLNYWEQELNQ